MGREELVAARQAPLLGLVPYAAVRRFDAATVGRHFVTERWQQFGQQPNQLVFEAGTPDQPVVFLYNTLDWDTQYFGFKAARLQAVLFGPAAGAAVLAEATQQFGTVLRAAGVRHCYAEVAATDPLLLYALGQASWSVVETRLHYYHDGLTNLTEPRSPVRPTEGADAETVRQVSAHNRNEFDRFHTDPVFTFTQGDDFLGEYAAACVRGLADVVLVPAAPTPVDSFLAVSYLTGDAATLNTGLGRVVLTAVGPQNRGWHRRLVSETLWHTHERGGEVVLMTTQATNRAVMRNSEALGFALGGTTHICSIIL